MANSLKQAIESIRSAKRVLALATLAPESRAYYEKQIKRGWEDIRDFRSDEKITVFLVKGLHECDTYYKDLRDVDWVLSDVGADELLDDGIPITIELELMSGREFGRLEITVE